MSGPEFPWDDRLLLGQTSSGTLTLVDFHPPESEVIDDLDLDADLEPAPLEHFKRPHVLEVRPHADPLAERAAFAFDTSFATRSVTGEVKVFRLRDDGEPVLAAVAPMRCTGAMHLAAAAPVLACATDQGIARWDLRLARTQPDARGRAPRSSRATSPASPPTARASPPPRGAACCSGRPTSVARRPTSRRRRCGSPSWSPRDPVLAVVESAGFEIVDFAVRAARTLGDVAAPTALFRGSLASEPTRRAGTRAGSISRSATASGGGRWVYLKRGGRAKDDAPPKGSPCARPAPARRPRVLARSTDFDELATRDLGPHSPLGGWRLGHHRFLTRDLVVFNATEPAAAHLLRFQGHDEIGGDEERDAARLGGGGRARRDAVAWQIGDEVRVYTLPDGNRLFSRRGHLLRALRRAARSTRGRPTARRTRSSTSGPAASSPRSRASRRW